ncbi:hypothetical protein JAAARDRAFT_618402 [Jaapia argillacea MUCL 33604]|uniref:Uncharacterized protein n=1 Tax=Jaapia argillacea MUCL 33604 TaxID=933084 RepID=A0A067PF55_9AGAM|nr:hypothetical protein JAAARDRAFT_618402 [Jaapia argillacea MUCL 33604]
MRRLRRNLANGGFTIATTVLVSEATTCNAHVVADCGGGYGASQFFFPFSCIYDDFHAFVFSRSRHPPCPFRCSLDSVVFLSLLSIGSLEWPTSFLIVILCYHRYCDLLSFARHSFFVLLLVFCCCTTTTRSLLRRFLDLISNSEPYSKAESNGDLSADEGAREKP